MQFEVAQCADERTEKKTVKRQIRRAKYFDENTKIKERKIIMMNDAET